MNKSFFIVLTTLIAACFAAPVPEPNLYSQPQTYGVFGGGYPYAAGAGAYPTTYGAGGYGASDFYSAAFGSPAGVYGGGFPITFL